MEHRWDGWNGFPQIGQGGKRDHQPSTLTRKSVPSARSVFYSPLYWPRPEVSSGRSPAGRSARCCCRGGTRRGCSGRPRNSTMGTSMPKFAPDRVLERVGDRAAVVGSRSSRHTARAVCDGWRQWHVGHRAIPGGIIGDDRFQARQLDELPAGILGQPVRASAKRVQADRFQKLDRRGHRQIGRMVARAGPDELVGPAFDASRRNASPAQHRRPDAGLMPRRDVQDSPSQTVRSATCGSSPRRNRSPGRRSRPAPAQGVRAVDGNRDAAAAGLAGRFA